MQDPTSRNHVSKEPAQRGGREGARSQDRRGGQEEMEMEAGNASNPALGRRLFFLSFLSFFALTCAFPSIMSSTISGT